MMDSESILLIGMVVGLFGSLMMLAGDLLQHLSTEVRNQYRIAGVLYRHARIT